MSCVEITDTVQLHFRSIRPNGEIFEDTHEQGPITVTLGQKQINPVFEEALLGKEEGETVSVTLPPEKAYGKFNKHLIIPLKRKKLNLDHEPKIGEIITVDVFKKKCRVIVAEVTDTKIIIDGNHPLAGETITYEITLVKNLGHEISGEDSKHLSNDSNL